MPLGTQSATTIPSSLAPLPLRLMLGVGFLYHGLPKLTAAGHTATVDMLSSLGVPVPGLTAWVVGGVEVLGALAILLGVLTRVASAVLIIEMLVAMALVHLPNGFNAMNQGYEINLLYIAMLMALLVGGPGAWAIGRLRRRVGRRAATVH